MKRRFVTFLAVAAVTAVGSLWWLHDADDTDAVSPLAGLAAAPDAVAGAAKAAWNADDLARSAGVVPRDPAPVIPDDDTDAATPLIPTVSPTTVSPATKAPAASTRPVHPHGKKVGGR